MEAFVRDGNLWLKQQLLQRYSTVEGTVIVTRECAHTKLMHVVLVFSHHELASLDYGAHLHVIS